jgi:hypothetical protein
MCFGDSTEDVGCVVLVAEQGTVSVVAAMPEAAVGDEADSTRPGDGRNLELSRSQVAGDVLCEPYSLAGVRQSPSRREEMLL